MQIDGRYVVWEDYRNPNPDGTGHGDIYGYDLLTGGEFPIAVGPSQQSHVQISGNLVVWQQRVDENTDIWGAYIPEPATGALLLLGCSALLRRRRP